MINSLSWVRLGTVCESIRESFRSGTNDHIGTSSLGAFPFLDGADEDGPSLTHFPL